MRLPEPLRQESDDTCAIACLRMILSHFGLFKSEAELLDRARTVAGGMEIKDLETLATSSGIQAETVRLDVASISDWIWKDCWTIAYVNRTRFGRLTTTRYALRNAIIHAVVPVQVTASFVTFNEPLMGARRRISRAKFGMALQDMSSWCLLCQRRH